MKEYYSQRAREYEAVYHRDDPLRQHEQEEMGTAIEEAMRNRRVLEVACGTGFWTERAAKTATHIVAIDASPETLEIARAKELPSSVEFQVGDAYLPPANGSFDAGLAMFWFSHVPRARLTAFLEGFHSALQKGATVFIGDNMYVDGVGGELIRKHGVDDTFKIRTLSDGSKHEVLKNYYDAEELTRIFNPLVEDLRIEMRNCFWWVQYETKR